MKTYQIGNKVTCIVRSFCPSTIGGVDFTYGNQPYTILKDVSVSLSFTETDKNATGGDKRRQLFFNTSGLNQVRLGNIHLTNKILKMLFNSYEQGLKSHYESVRAEEELLYLSVSADTIYQVFIYDINEQLVDAQAQFDISNGYIDSEKVHEYIEDHPEEEEYNFLVVYETLGNTALKLNSPVNTYFTLDFICEGNTDDETAPTYIHIQKAGLRAEKSLYFNNSLNAVDLTFNVIETEDDFIVLD